MNRNVLAVVVVVAIYLLSFCVCAVSAGNWTRPMSTATITTLPTEAYDKIIDSFGGNRTIDTEANATVNWTKFLQGELSVWTLTMGDLALIIIIAMPFLGMFLMHQDMVPAAIAGMIIGCVLLIFVPPQFTLLAGVFVVLSIVVVVYRLLKER